MKTEIRRPRGRATIRAMANTNMVPETNGNTPNCLALKKGAHVSPDMNAKKLTWVKKPIVSKASTRIMPTVTNNEINPQKPKNKAANFSLRCDS